MFFFILLPYQISECVSVCLMIDLMNKNLWIGKTETVKIENIIFFFTSGVLINSHNGVCACKWRFYLIHSVTHSIPFTFFLSHSYIFTHFSYIWCGKLCFFSQNVCNQFCLFSGFLLPSFFIILRRINKVCRLHNKYINVLYT